MDRIKEYKKTFIDLEQLEKILSIRDYSALCSTIEEYVEKGWLEPVQAQGITGKNPPLYKKYKIIREQPTGEEYIKEMKACLPPSFSIDYYKSNIPIYKIHREHILNLADYFKRKRNNLTIKMSINERSFDIWGEEKFLKDSGMCSVILKNLGLDLSVFNIYRTPEPFFYYSKSKNPGQNILILENKDTWYTMKELMREGISVFFGIEFGTVIYGEGKKIRSSFAEINDLEESWLTSRDNVFYYFGDLDNEGISIYTGFMEMYKPLRDIRLLKEAYIKMFEIADMGKLQKMKDNQQISRRQVFLNEFEEDVQPRIVKLLDKGLYIPQEIINYQILKGGQEIGVRISEELP